MENMEKIETVSPKVAMYVAALLLIGAFMAASVVLWNKHDPYNGPPVALSTTGGAVCSPICGRPKE